MTSIVVAPRVEDPTSDVEAIASGGWFRVRPSRAYKAGGQWVHPVWPATVTPLNGSAVTVKLDPIADVPYELELSIPDGNGGSYHPPNEFRYVTASASPLNWEDLTQAAGPTGGSAPLPSSLEARLLALETLYSTLSGGASTLASITDMTAVARALNAKTTTATMLTYLGAAPTGAAVDTDVMHLAGNETVTGIKTHTLSPIIPTPTTGTQAANKSYVDTQAASGTPDATTSLKGKVQLAGDLAGTSAAPVVAKVNGITVTGTPTAGQALVASSGTAAAWAGVTPAISGVSDVPGLVTALAGKRAALGVEPGDTFTIQKDTVTGFWPASWTGKTPSYSGGSTSAGVRPTSDATVTCIWKGADPSPAIVSTGTAGMRDNIDVRWVH